MMMADQPHDAADEGIIIPDRTHRPIRPRMKTPVNIRYSEYVLELTPSILP
jgi:hypothetical protein